MTNTVAKVFSAELEGIDGRCIEVETDLSAGLHSFNIVGLADKALSEAKERVNAALKNSALKPPNRENRRITVNLAPADIKKTGSQYDLAIAIGYLMASGQIKNFVATDKMFIGELSLNGDIRPVAGALSFAETARHYNIKYLFLPPASVAEASLIKGVKLIPVTSLTETIGILEGRLPTPDFVPAPPQPTFSYPINLSDIKGQDSAKRALLISASGGHNLLMCGPPGSGKSMLAQSLASILPVLSDEETIAVTKIWSVSNLNQGQVVTLRPFRSPHHTSSSASIIGGGQIPRPGEISLAHRGVLFLDEIPEFRRDVLEALRQPLESGDVFISRARGAIKFPSRFTLIAAMNPCPCGYFTDDSRECTCTAQEVIRYQKKLSGPLLDRLDLQVNVPRLNTEDLMISNHVPSSLMDSYRSRVNQARARQQDRFQRLDFNIITNSELSSKQCDALIDLDTTSQQLIKTILEKSLISARGYYRLLKIARTIADLEGENNVTSTHLKEAFQYRLKDQPS